MAFDRLTALGTEKFHRIIHELRRGTPTALLARMIRDEWGDVRDVREDTLARQLGRLGKTSRECWMDDEPFDLRPDASVRPAIRDLSTLDCLDISNISIT